jgi:hypothetical protein
VSWERDQTAICESELIDGSYDYCGCPDCNDREADDREREAEFQ